MTLTMRTSRARSATSTWSAFRSTCASRTRRDFTRPIARPELTGTFKRVMRSRFYETEIKLRSDRYEINGDSADVKLGLMTAVGPLSADIGLRKTGPGSWKVSRVHIEP